MGQVLRRRGITAVRRRFDLLVCSILSLLRSQPGPNKSFGVGHGRIIITVRTNVDAYIIDVEAAGTPRRIRGRNHVNCV